MFEQDRSAARGEMSARKLVIFKHESKLGNAPAHVLFDRISVSRKVGNETFVIGDERLENLAPARSFDDYAVTVNTEDLPAGVEIVEAF
jgi:CRISPR-associated protein Csd2